MAHAYRRALAAAILGLTATGADAAPRTLCVLVPHFKDSYWLSVAYGIETRAEALGVRIRFFEAGGYRARETQIHQIADCGGMGADAVLIGAVSSDHPDLLAAIAGAGRPVIGLVNELRSDALAARIGVDWHEMGAALGRDLALRHPAGSAPRRAILLSGPAESGWVGPLEAGLAAGLSGSAVEILAVYRADTGLRQQLRLLERALADWPDPDLIIGDAPAIEAAMALREAGADNPPELAATYFSHGIARGIVGGQVLTAPFDDPVRQGEMALDAAMEAIDGATRSDRSGPAITLVRRGEEAQSARMSPADYFPALN